MFQSIKRTVQWKRFKRKKKGPPSYTSQDASDSQRNPSSRNHTQITRSLKAVLTILGELAGAPTVVSFAESLNKDEDRSTRKGLEEYCHGLLETVKLVMDKEVPIMPQPDNLPQLHSKLAVIHEEICNCRVQVDVEAISRKIANILQLFLFESYLGGLITRPDQYDTMEKHILSQAIRDLPRAKAAYNDYTKDNRRVPCFEGTREAILQEIARWLSAGGDSRAYLLFGIAGIGKSTVAQTIAEMADKFRYLGASFFFSRDEADRRTAEKVFTTIAFQLCVYDEEFARAIGRALTEEQGAAATTKEPQEQLRALIVEPLRSFVSSRPYPIAIVIDALDECNAEDGPKILMALDRLVRELPFFKVILTTRPQPHLQYLLDRLGKHKVFHLQSIEETVVDGDIRLYLRHCFSLDQVHTRLPMLRRKWTANDEEIEFLVSASGRLFIIASTAVLFVLDAPACNPASRMKILQDAFAKHRTPFNTLNDFYTVILRSAVPLGCELDIVERYQAVVGTIVLIEVPLPVGALANLISVLADDMYAVLDYLQSVISLGSNSVPLVYHKSFPDYITDDKRCQDTNLRIVPRAHHTRLATCCLRIMNKHLKRNILELSGHAQFFNNKMALEEELISWDRVQQVISSELQYAAIHWASHVSQADLKDCRLMTELKVFTEEHLLHWLEALSWIRKLDTAHISLNIVLRLQTLDFEMNQIFSDTFRFISRDYDKIAQSALYTYHSALPFKPTRSLLYKKYRHEALLCEVEGGPAQWDILVTEKKHGRKFVSHVAFAKDSSRFASWDVGSIKLWDGASGTPLRTFDGKEIVLADDFSALAVPRDNSVAMYSIPSGAPIASFDHSAKVFQVAVSFNGLQLAVGLQSGMVHIWDVVKGVSTAILDGYDGCQLAFSPTGRMLSFTSNGGINLWNGADIVVMLGHGPDKPIKVAFSGDSTRLATLAKKDNKYSLRLWNGEDGDLIAVARDVQGEELAVSANGSLVVTGGDNREVQLWSGDSLELLTTLPINLVWALTFSGDILAIASWLDHTVTLYDVKSHASVSKLQIRRPTSLTFSPDGTRLTAGNLFGTVYLWDVPSIRESAATSRRQLSPVSALSFSPDCSWLACGHADGSVELWDTGHMRRPISCNKLHSRRISALAFSPDGNQLASGSTDKRVRFWDGRDGVSIGVLEHLFPDRLTSLAISSTLLAAATDSVITLWDRTSLHLINIFNQGSYKLLFSLDGSVLTSSRWRDSQFMATIWNTQKHIVPAMSKVDQTSPLPDDSTLISPQKNVGPGFLDLVNREGIDDPENLTFIKIPHLNGIPISWEWGRLVGRFSARHDRVPVLWIPQNFHVREFASQSSMFALGCEDGRILLIRPTADR